MLELMRICGSIECAAEGNEKKNGTTLTKDHPLESCCMIRRRLFWNREKVHAVLVTERRTRGISIRRDINIHHIRVNTAAVGCQSMGCFRLSHKSSLPFRHLYKFQSRSANGMWPFALGWSRIKNLSGYRVKKIRWRDDTSIWCL